MNARNLDLDTFIPILAAYREHYARATDAQKAEGRAWYPAAADVCRTIAQESGRDWRNVARAMAALSPRLRWTANVDATWDTAYGRTPRVLRLNAIKARTLMDGLHHRETLSGIKVRSFAAALLGNRHAATIDAWMLKASGHLSPAKASGQTAYIRACKQALATLARETGEDTRDIQAIIWIVARGASQ